MAPAEYMCAADGLEAPHRSNSPFQVLVIALQPVVEVFRGSMLCQRQNRSQRRWITLCLISRDAPGRTPAYAHRSLKNPLGRGSITPVAQVDINNLTMLINGSKEIARAAANLEVRFVHAPPVTNCGAVRPCCSDKPWGESAHPVIDGAWVHLDAALRQPLGDICITQPIAVLPAECEGNVIVGKAIAPERRA